jgi:acetylornithine deacetylase/succinyl-diaminopimelate desuccinylase-like protein
VSAIRPRPNVIPSVAEATLDCRVPAGITKEDWLAEIERRLADPSIKIEIISAGEDPAVSPQDSAAVTRALESAIKRQHPTATITPMTVPYGTDGNGFRPQGVKVYGIFPAVIPAASILSMHGDAEFVPADALGPAIKDPVRSAEGDGRALSPRALGLAAVVLLTAAMPAPQRRRRARSGRVEP